MSYLSFLKDLNKDKILPIVAITGIVVTAGLIYYKQNSSFGLLSISNIFGKSKDEIAKATIDFINKNKLSGTTASLSGVSEESGLVKIKIKIGDNEFDSYVSKDGRFLFPQAIDMSVSKNNDLSESDPTQPTEEEKQQARAAIQKTDNPMLEAYVVSRCPFGIQMQRAIAEAVKTVPSMAKYIKVRYMGSISNGKVTAMHGDEEAQENLRQICIREEQPARYWDYLACQMKAGETTGCERPSGVDSDKLSACVSTSSRGLAYAQKDFDLNQKYKITGSPTLILNGQEVSEFNFGGRSAEAVKSIVCAAFNSEPSFCSTKLNEASAATGFSETYSSASGSNSASCE